MLIGGGLVGGLALLVAANQMCLSAYFSAGITVGACPLGTPHQSVEAGVSGVRRGSPGHVWVRAPVWYTTGRADEAQFEYTSRFTPRAELVVDGKAQPLTPEKGWHADGNGQSAKVSLPKDLPDGDHLVRVTIDAPLGTASADVPLAVYAPARIHVLTDRPLYEPGHTVQFRAVTLRARDLAPLDGRPGRFEVTDPDGTVVLEAKAPAGPFGVASGDFPLDEGAPTGVWWVRYKSGDAEASTSIRVEPFTLPRFTVSAAPARPSYGIGDRPVVRGEVRYSSGAPVRGARLELTWSAGGGWPPPTAWMQGELPTSVYVENDGRFRLDLPRVPSDLLGQAFLRANIEAIDPTGDRATGALTVRLAQYGIDATAVTELAGGLVEGFNNRMYVRVTRPEGAPLPKTRIVVRRAWDPEDPGITARTDADGVAALQVDPGPAVNVLVPAPPVRPPPRPDPVERTGLSRVGEGGVGLDDQLRFDRQEEARLLPCARFVESDAESVQVGLRVGANGRVASVTAGTSRLARCVAAAARGLALAPGAERVLEAEWVLRPDLPSVSVSIRGTPVVPDAVRAALEGAALDARECLAPDQKSADLGRALVWEIGPGEARLALRFVDGPARATRLGATAARCVQDRLTGLTLAEPYGQGAQRAFGTARVQVRATARTEPAPRPDRTKLGYELAIEAFAGEGEAAERIGRTKLFVAPGAVPDVRLRAEPVLAEPGQTVQVKLLRGPGFTGKLPDKLAWRHDGNRHELEWDKAARTAELVLPKDASGWFEVEGAGARALVFVRDAAELQVELSSDKDVYAPGETAHLTLATTSGGQGTAAAVGVFGVDETLGQLATLLGPEALDSLRVAPRMNGMAFGVLDGQALALGRVQGANAAAATVLRVARAPAPEAIDRPIDAQAEAMFDPVAPLTDAFYRALGRHYTRVRAWEREAAEAERMRPATMARLWGETLDAMAASGTPATDAYGRRLRLGDLPNDLLALVDPRVVVVDGTRLPEDVENWTQWVREERP